ncbi:MAG: uroporphyrinogen-III synthase [Pontibacterium sp.]
MNAAALKGMRVLVTRPALQAEPQTELLRALGAEPVSLPLIEIHTIEASDPAYQRARSHFLDLDLYQKVIFISANAAHFGAQWIDQYWPQLPIGIRWLAIGKKTAATLTDYGIDAESASLGYDSEALLNDLHLQEVEGERILIVRGQGGRTLLAESLRARGAQVEYADLYQRRCPGYADSTIKDILYQQAPDALLITSGEGLDNLLQLANGRQRQFSTKALLNYHLVVPSERIAKQARLAGFKRITRAAGPDDQSMINALLPATDAEIDR